MRIDVYHHWPELKVIHEFPQPFIIQIKDEKPTLKGGNFMFIVKDNNPDVGYSIEGIEVTDAEGQVIPDSPVNIALYTSDDTVVQIIPDPADQKKGTVHFGAPGFANLNCIVTLEDGTAIGSFGAQFTVTVGDPAAIKGGTIKFEGLTEAPEPPTP